MTKLTVIFVMVMLLIVTACAIAKSESVDDFASHIYPACGRVVEIDRRADLVIVEDCVGFLWAFKDTEDWAVGDLAAMIMEDNGTEEIFDDKILDVRYCGTGWE